VPWGFLPLNVLYSCKWKIRISEPGLTAPKQKRSYLGPPEAACKSLHGTSGDCALSVAHSPFEAEPGLRDL